MTAERWAALTRASREHYEQHPFLEGGPERVERWEHRLQELLPSVDGLRLLDVGCGSGEVAAALRNLKADISCIDLTSHAAARAASLGLRTCQADALRLPFPDRAFDASISMGVLHHTADCAAAVQELTRVTASWAVVLLYARWTPYHLAYRALLPLSRRVRVDRLEQLPRLVKWFLRQTVRALTGLRVDDAQVRRVMADQFWTPRATFHSLGQLRGWADGSDWTVSRIRRVALYSDIYILRPRKRGRG